MTKRTHQWNEFQRWCSSRGMKALPAHPWTVASYLRWVDRRKDVEEARAALIAITREHVFKTGRVPTRHATVKSTMDLIERKALTRAQHADLFDEKELLQDKPLPVLKDQEDQGEDATPKQSVQRRRPLSTQPRMVRRRRQKL